MIHNAVFISAVEQSESVLHRHISTLVLRFFSHIGHYRVLSRVPCAIHQVLTGYLFLYIVVCIMSVHISQLIPTPTYPQVTMFVFYNCDSISVL